MVRHHYPFPASCDLKAHVAGRCQAAVNAHDTTGSASPYLVSVARKIVQQRLHLGDVTQFASGGGSL